MHKMYKNWVLTALLLLCAVPAPADMLFLRDGSRLTGALVGINDGTLSFRTKLAGKIFVPVDEIHGVSTSSFVVVALGAEKLLPGRLKYQDGKTFVIHRSSHEERPIDLAQVTEVTTLPAAFKAGPERAQLADSPIEVSLGTGYRWRSGTENRSGPFVESELKAGNESTAFSVRVRSEYLGDEGRYDRFYDAQARVRFGPEDQWRPELSIDLERDADKGLDLRGDLTLGAARHFINGEKQKLEGMIGIGVALERYDAKLLEDDDRRGIRDERHNDDALNLNLSFRYTRLVFKKGTLTEELILRPSLSDPGDLRAQWESALLMPVAPWMRLKFDVLVDYEDHTRFRHIDEWQTAVGASLRFDF